MTWVGLFSCEQWGKPEMHESFPHTVNWKKSATSRFFLWVRDSVGILIGEVRRGFMSHFETRCKTHFCTLPVSQHLLCPSARPSLSPNISSLCLIPIALISHLFHTSCKERVKDQGFLYSSLVKHWDPLSTDTGDSGVGREEKFEGFLNSLFLISAW